MSDEPAVPDVDRILEDVHAAAGPPRLPPLRLPDVIRSRRGGIVGGIATAARRLARRVLEPSLVDLVTQLERDRHHQRAEIARLEARIAALEATSRDDR